MKPGDLVAPNVEGSPDIGVIIEKYDYRRGVVWLVYWNDDEFEPFHEDDLRVIDEAG